jgi:hypothetical protein
MGLYLCVFADPATDEELEGVEVGGYDDFNRFRETVAEHLEPSGWGSRFPVLMQHPDSDGAWTPAEAVGLEQELLAIRDGLARLAPVPFAAGWQQELARQVGLRPASLLECFIDVDGEPLVERLIELAGIARSQDRDISFQ